MWLIFENLCSESGDDEVLARINKGETFESSLAALDKIHAAGLKSSVMVCVYVCLCYLCVCICLCVAVSLSLSLSLCLEVYACAWVCECVCV